jgi:hypothetical protein
MNYILFIHVCAPAFKLHRQQLLLLLPRKETTIRDEKMLL